MSNLPIPARDSVEAQRDMFRLAAKECGLTIAAIAHRSPLAESTLKGWRDGAAMPAWALGALGAAGVPDHLLSLIIEPFARHVGSNETADGDLDTLAREGAHFLADKADAEAHGVVTHVEMMQLKESARRIAGVARRVAA